MKRSRLAALLASVAACLAAPAPAHAVDEVKRCTEEALRLWITAPTHYAERFAWEASTCVRHYGDRLRNPERLAAYQACMEDAVDRYMLLIGFEATAHFAVICTEKHLQTSIYYRPH